MSQMDGFEYDVAISFLGEDLTLADVRCLRELRLCLQQGLNVLVGRNNVGKTSLLAAIRHALGAGAGRGKALWLTDDDFHRPGPEGFPSMYFSTREANDWGDNSDEGDRGDGPGCGNCRDEAGGAARAAAGDKRDRKSVV